MSEQFPSSNNEYRDDGGYADAMESGDPAQVEKALDAVRNSLPHDIPSSHVNEDTRDPLPEYEQLSTTEEQILDKTPEESDNSINIFSEEQAQTVEDNGAEEEIIGKVLPLEIDLSLLPEGQIKVSAEKIANATSLEDFDDQDDIDICEQHIEDIRLNYNEDIADKLSQHMSELYSVAQY